MTPARDLKQCPFSVIWEEASGRKHLGRGIWEEASGNVREGIWEKASGRRHLGGLRERLWEGLSSTAYGDVWGSPARRMDRRRNQRGLINTAGTPQAKAV